MFRLLKLQIFLLLLAVVVVAGLVGDLVAKSKAESALAETVHHDVPRTVGVRASIASFPVIGRLIVTGKVPAVRVTAQQAVVTTVVGDVALIDVTVEVHDVELDRGKAIHGRVAVRSIGRGSVKASLSQDALNGRLPHGFTVRLETGKATVTGPLSTQAQLVAGPKGGVQLVVAGKAVFSLDVPESRLLPCAPQAAFVSGGLSLSCSFTKVPDLLVGLTR